MASALDVLAPNHSVLSEKIRMINREIAILVEEGVVLRLEEDDFDYPKLRGHFKLVL